MNEQDQDDLLHACERFEFIEDVTEFACGWDEGHIEDYVDKEYEELEDVEKSEEDSGVVEDTLVFAEFAKDTNVYVKECNNQKKDG